MIYKYISFAVLLNFVNYTVKDLVIHQSFFFISLNPKCNCCFEVFDRIPLLNTQKTVIINSCAWGGGLF